MRALINHFRRVLFFAVLLSMSTMIASSCSSSKNNSKIKKIHRQSKKHVAPTDSNAALLANTGSRKIKKALKKDEKRRKAAFKAHEKAKKNDINRSHLSAQTKETQKRMAANRKQAERNNKRLGLIR